MLPSQIQATLVSGTTSPSAKLDVNGVSRISGDFAGTGIFLNSTTQIHL